jgi:uncharacterized membrane protein (DUF2068 family)
LGRFECILGIAMSELQLKIKETNQAKGRHSNRTMLLVIAGFKLFKGILLLALAVGALRLLNGDIDEHVRHWMALIRVDPDNRHFHGALMKIAGLDNRKLEEISAGSFFYAILLLTEGIGLWLGKRWAEYFTIIVTGSFIPLEIYELVERVSVPKVIALLVNVAIVWYLVVRLRRKNETDEE